MASTTKHCKICGAQYDYCPTCGRDINKPKWYISFDRAECKKLFDILAANGSGQTSNEKTLDELKAMNYKSMKIVNQGVLNHISRIENAQSDIKDVNTVVEAVDVTPAKEEQTQQADQTNQRTDQTDDLKDTQEAQDVQEEKDEPVLSMESTVPGDNQSFKKNKHKNKNEGSAMPSFLGYADRIEPNDSIG